MLYPTERPVGKCNVSDFPQSWKSRGPGRGNANFGCGFALVASIPIGAKEGFEWVDRWEMVEALMRRTNFLLGAACDISYRPGRTASGLCHHSKSTFEVDTCYVFYEFTQS